MQFKILPLILWLQVFCAIGQNTTTVRENGIAVQEVVISDSKWPQKDSLNLNFDVLKKGQMVQSGSVSLSDALTAVAGVSNTSTGPGIGRPVIRGLSGNRIVTSLNGIRLENQQWDPEHALGLSFFGYDRVEVIKGPSTLLYGPGAMGGVLNFVDEKKATENTFKGDFFLSQHSNTLGTIGSLGLHGAGKKWYCSFRAGANNHSDYYTGGDYQRIANSRFREGNSKALVGYNNGHSDHQLIYQFNTGAYGIVEPFEKAGKDKEAHPMEFETPYHTNMHHTLALKNNLKLGRSRLKSQLSYQNDNRKELESGNADGNPFLGFNLNTGYGDVRWESDTLKGRSVVLGTQAMLQQNSNFGYSWLIADYKQKDIGFFVVANSHVSLFHFEGGLRYDFSQLETERTGFPLQDNYLYPLNRHYSNLSGSFATRYQVTPSHHMKLNVGTGFRSPNVSELTSNGFRLETQRFEYGNNSFVKEQNQQVDLNDQIVYKHCTFETSVFYNKVQNFIFIAPSGMFSNGHPVYQYHQSDGALYGGELMMNIQPLKSKKMKLQTTISYTTGKVGEQFLPLMPPVRLKNNLIFYCEKWGKLKKLNITIGCLTVLKQTRLFQTENETPGYVIVNISFNAECSYRAFPFVFGIGSNNLLNQTYYDHLSRLRPYGVYGMGLDIFVNLIVPFGS